MTTQEMMAILAPAVAGGIGSAVNSRQQGQQNAQSQQNTAVQQQMQALANKAQVLQALQQNRQQNAQSGLNAMPLGQEQAYASRAKAMQALLPMLAKYQNARPTDPGIAGATRSSGPNLVQGLAGNQGFQNTFSDQMTSQSLADRRKAIAGVNPDYEFSSLGGFGMDASYDQGVNDARGSALSRLQGFEGQQQALADQQVDLAMGQGSSAQQQQQQPEKKKGIWSKLGKVAKVAVPIVLAATGVGAPAAAAIMAGTYAASAKADGKSWGDAAKSGVIGGATGAVGAGALGSGARAGISAGTQKAASMGVLNGLDTKVQGGSWNEALASGASGAAASKLGDMAKAKFQGGGSGMNNQMTPQSLPMGSSYTDNNNPGAGLARVLKNSPQLQLASRPLASGMVPQSVQQQPAQQPQLPMFNKADPRGGTPNPGVKTPQGQFHGQGPQGFPLRNAAPPQAQPWNNSSPGLLAPTKLEQGGTGETAMWDLYGQMMDQPFIKAMQSPMAQVGLGGMIGGQVTGPPAAAGPMKALPPGQYNMGPATPKPYVNTQATNWPAAPQGQLGAGPMPKMLGPGPQAPQVLPPATMPMGPVGSSSMARGSTFNLPAQSGSTMNNQLNAQQILQVLSGNNGMSPQQKAQFLASPQAQAVLQQLQTAQKLPAGMRPDQIMRLIVGGQ